MLAIRPKNWRAYTRRLFMRNPKKVLFLCSFWGEPGNVGMFRAERMVRWLHDAGFEVIIVRAGLTDRSESFEYGTVVTIKDPLGMHGDIPADKQGGMPAPMPTDRNRDKLGDIQGERQTEKLANPTPDSTKPQFTRIQRAPNPLRRWLAYALLVPDPAIVWVRRAVRHSLVLEQASTCSWFLASSPPESGFLGASALAKRFNGNFVMDMRDGWLDEPMKPLLRVSKLQQWREQRLEKRMVTQAHTIVVTSEKWREMLRVRYANATQKVVTITNAYPPDDPLLSDSVANPVPRKSGIMRFVHAGRIFSSRPQRKIRYLLQPMLSYAANHPGEGEILFLGDLVAEEENELMDWKNKFREYDWGIMRHPSVKSDVAAQIMRDCDGLLLLSASNGSIPAKFFNYVAAQKPIFSVTFEGSALQHEASLVSQCILLDYNKIEDYDDTFSTFVNLAKSDDIPYQRPAKFEEANLRKVFLDIFRS
jgi:hypothetical protein